MDHSRRYINKLKSEVDSKKPTHGYTERCASWNTYFIYLYVHVGNVLKILVLIWSWRYDEISQIRWTTSAVMVTAQLPLIHSTRAKCGQLEQSHTQVL